MNYKQVDSKLRKFLRYLPSILLDGLKLSVAFVVSRILRLSKKWKGIWLIGERFDEARDNGYHLFKYIRTCHPDVKVYYVITPTSPDYRRVAELGPTIFWNSFRHFLYWMVADRIISAHDAKLAPGTLLCRLLARFGVHSRKSVMLQHGVMAITLPRIREKRWESHALIAVSAQAERDFLIHEGGHEEEVVALLGLCRFDGLYGASAPKKRILVMPTWRRWFRDWFERYGLSEAMAKFKTSEYFRAYNRLLQSKRLSELLARENYELVFYPHYRMQPYLDAFNSINEERIIVADKQNYDVQQLLRESAILITDFSSVSFDFAFMERPLIYFLPDEERFFSEHSKRGYFDFESDGFGPVCRDAEAVVDALEEILEQEAALQSIYRDRVRRFFAYRDNRNCERTYEAIRAIVV